MSAWLGAYRWLGYPALRAGFSAAGLFLPKVRRGLAMRAGAPWMRAPEGCAPIWFHCASGEFEYAKPVIRALKARWPAQPVLVTYFSPSAEKPVASFPGVDFATPAPWDEPRALAAFIARIRPRALLIARTDVWPEMAEQARAHGVPSLLFSATLTSGSGRSSPLARPASRLSFAPLTRIFCVSEGDRQEFARLGFANKASVEGDTRFDQVLARLAEPKPIRDELFAGGDPTLVAGSTWGEDEGPLLESAAALKGRVRFALVPHEPTPAHIAELEARALAAGLPTVRYSTSPSWPPGAALIVDQVGILAELYAKGRFAFVGGSFRKTVHSVMEPLACGALTFVGPLHLNNREAIEFQGVAAGAGLTAVRTVADGHALARAIEAALAAPEAPAKEAIQAAVRARAGQGTARVIEWIAEILGRERKA